MANGKFNGIKTDKASVQSIEAKTHNWLKQNRPGYNAERWAFIIENYTEPGKFTIPLPPEKDSILSVEELAAVVDGPLPPEWFPPAENLI